MKNIFISNIKIQKVRHLQDIEIILSQDKIKHLIFTGKNGSGKTSVLEALASHLNAAATSDRLEKAEKFLKKHMDELGQLRINDVENSKILEAEKAVERYSNELAAIQNGICVTLSESRDSLYYHFQRGQFVIAYYKAERIFEAIIPKHVEKVKLKETYEINDSPRKEFVKYIVDLKVTESLARGKGEIEKADNIKRWFEKFENLLKDVFEDDSLELVFEFEGDEFSFSIRENGREPFDFNTLSSGYSAVLDIILDIMIRMEKATNKSFDYNIPGIVLIDEIETHLHLEMQKKVLGMLTRIFPNIQFIVSTHSPFILSSLENALIYDLENGITVENGLSDIPYAGIVEGYFEASTLSDSLAEKYERYKELVNKEDLTDDDFEEIAGLELYLNEIPDYLALDITTEYQRLKLQFESREDV